MEKNGYGVHPTQYGKLSNDQLYGMFRESVYTKLNESEKRDLLQETVNRDAMEKGMVGAPLVQFADLPATESGNAENGYINVNRDIATRGIQSVEYNGQVLENQIRDYNIQALNTVLHEDEHCLQDQIINGTVIIDDMDLTQEYMANDFTTSAVLKDGSYKLGSQYVTGETPGGYYFYYFQPTERDAYLNAENKTASILAQLTSKFGTEDSFAAYETSILTKGYQATEQNAIQLFQNPEFVKDVSTTLQNEYYKTNIPVNDIYTQNAMKTEMIASYQAMQLENETYNKAEAKEDIKMDFSTKTMELDENNILAETVNESEPAVEAEGLREGGISDDSAAAHAGGSVGVSNDGESAGDGIDLDGGEGADDGLDL